MNPSRSGDQTFEFGLGLDFDVEVTVADDTTQGIATDTSRDKEAVMTYLVKFDPDVTPVAAESVLSKLTPPEEGIILAGRGAVIIRACREFVEFARGEECVVLINAVRTTQWEPNRHQVPAKPE